MNRVFTFVVAINKYSAPQIQNLRKCIDDAELIQSYLRDRFDETHIRSLYNENATREAILTGFRTHLIENTQIEHGDPIIFYFAGHGCRVSAPAQWRTTDGSIETICPYDELTMINGILVPGIPDLTIAGLLRELGKRKGNNITVIFDCCHSGGATRKCPSLVRCRSEYSAAESDDIPFPDADETIWIRDAGTGSATATLRTRGLGRSDSCYVLLAACGQEETALDGYFTEHLVNSLRDPQLRPNSTYADVLASLPIASASMQHPQCGWNSDRMLFTTAADCAHNRFALKSIANGKYQVNAWGIHGVRAGMHFTVVGSRKALLVEAVQQFSSVVVPLHSDAPSGIVDGAAASLNIELTAFLCAPLSISSNSSCGVTIKTIPAEADIIVSGFLNQNGKGRLRVESRDLLLTSLSCHVTDVAWDTVGPFLPRYLQAIADFRYNLGRDSRNIASLTELAISEHPADALAQDFTVELLRLEPLFHGLFQVPATPETNLFSNRVAKLVLDSDVTYCIRLQNTRRHLFFYLFYFNPSDYSVEVYQRHHKTEAPAPKTVTVGYGAGGGDPIGFVLGEDQIRDSGFLKVFVSTEYCDMRSLEQPAAAESGPRLFGRRVPEIHGEWSAWLGVITVVKE
ncbi:hypothetical protein B0H19DRAFT_1042189 [Mycena capillaripes]|nr:hypothetical protein B0H19DRAFT_1042189 [Mycena capillaripes]